MSRALLVLANPAIRQRAKHWIDTAEPFTRVEFKAPKRTLEQNALMWVLLTRVAGLEWQGERYSPDDWKDYFMHALKRARWMPNEEGGMVPIGMRTSDLGKDEMSDLIELIYGFGARHGVEFDETQCADPITGELK